MLVACSHADPPEPLAAPAGSEARVGGHLEAPRHSEPKTDARQPPSPAPPVEPPPLSNPSGGAASNRAAGADELAPATPGTEPAKAALPIAAANERPVEDDGVSAGTSGGPPLGVTLSDGSDSMRLVSLAVGTAVQDRKPVGVAVRFREVPPRFHCHSAVDSRVPSATIVHTWRRGARVISRVELEVGKSPAWRTWSRQRIRSEWADRWSCTVTTLDGAILGTAHFEVLPKAEGSAEP